MNIFQALVFGMVQGVTELFPISSLGHSIIIPKLFAWNFDQHAPFFLTFLAATHTATALVLLFYFRKEWRSIAGGFFRLLTPRATSEKDPAAKMAGLLTIATLPPFLLGVLVAQPLQNLLASPTLVAMVLMSNGLLLFAAEAFRRKPNREFPPEKGSLERIAELTWFQALGIGLLQSLGFVPGLSRTGAALAGGLLAGLSHKDALHFSLLLATPILGVASLFRLPELALHTASPLLTPIAVSVVATVVMASLSVRVVTRYFETKRLWPFAVYCLGGGLLAFVYFFLT